MEKHTRPYSCQDPKCNGRSFGDKAGLQRHEKEKHSSEKFCCPVRPCPRSVRGFGRKRNLDLHISRRHRGQMTGGVPVAEGSMVEDAGMNSDSPDSVGDLELLVAPEGIESLSATLWEFEAKKTKLVEDHAKVDAVIDSLKKAMEVVLRK
jgi:hypothetical protein